MKKCFHLLIAILLSACSNNVDTAEVKSISEQEYADYNCQQISAEMRRVSSKLEGVKAAQPESEGDTLKYVLGTALQVYGMSQGYQPDNSKTDNAQKILEVRYETLERLSIDKECF
ncbi:MAG: hypothetical protein P8P30_00215 [Rickettsiales bacterium]|nr:hypothetical protein [Rickettsiales bacterium]